MPLMPINLTGHFLRSLPAQEMLYMAYFTAGCELQYIQYMGKMKPLLLSFYILFKEYKEHPKSVKEHFDLS